MFYNITQESWAEDETVGEKQPEKSSQRQTVKSMTKMFVFNIQAAAGASLLPEDVDSDGSRQKV